MTLSIRNMAEADYPAIQRIYNHYIEHSIATFDEQTFSLEQIHAKLAPIQANYPALVAEREGTVLGYAYANAFKPKSAYRVTAETTVYLAPAHHGQGIGENLYRELLASLPEFGVRNAMAIISLPNPGSIALHQKLGFEKVGCLKQVGCKFGEWLDVEYWQLILD